MDEPANASERPPVGGSFEYESLMLLWSLGALPSYVLQMIADGRVRDGPAPVAMRRLASIGYYGMYPNNCRRNLMRMLAMRGKLAAQTLSGQSPDVERSVIEGG